jgi:hypothetical protein
MTRRFSFALTLAGLMMLGTGCTTPAPQQPALNFKTELTIQDIMDSVIDPSADYIWESVSTVVNDKGITDKAPSTDEEWREERRHAVLLMEAANLLKIPGRAVARPGARSTAPGIEEEPEGTKKLMDADPVTWGKATDTLYDAARIMLKAAEAKDPEAILDAGNTLDQACEGCHIVYWYPRQTELLKEATQAK